MKGIVYLVFSYLLYSLNLLYPQLAFLANLFIPMFFVLFFYDSDNLLSDRKKFFIFVISFFILSIYSYKVAINIFLMAGVPALSIYFRYIKNKIKLEPVIFAPLPAFIVTVFILLFVGEIREGFYRYIVGNLDMVINSLKNIPESEVNINVDQLIKRKEEFASIILYIIPAVSYVYISFMTLIAKRVILFKLGRVSEVFRVPFHMVWLLIIGGFTFLSDRLEIKVISYNTFIIFTYLFFIQGSNLISIILTRKKLIWLRVIILILLLVHPYIIIAIAFIGLFDNWFNFASVAEDDKKN
ncbi:DUF2232 domain-containing protein [Calditerrivibrio nitroreducens]|uniref:DUF2232 domain-containing protein n=1 Tax=Calditerrivibrio nitroreducens (strain DSM 19672 / NBRC 101217 / Yu37-1) TaxID=768670 RepID=E4TF92_CALNY|nr:DUF2232 domain-containing protein [Calditerrivibrio nitroreducens]ADR18431.1 Protein of unknown function DUF2232, membrane [Calditerrivibrio nitroreducens DSM 19672]